MVWMTKNETSHISERNVPNDALNEQNALFSVMYKIWNENFCCMILWNRHVCGTVWNGSILQSFGRKLLKRILMNIKCMRDTLWISRPLLRCSFNGTNDMKEVERNVETIPATPLYSHQHQNQLASHNHIKTNYGICAGTFLARSSCRICILSVCVCVLCAWYFNAYLCSI